jgi:hypothetical protein
MASPAAHRLTIMDRKSSWRRTGESSENQRLPQMASRSAEFMALPARWKVRPVQTMAALCGRNSLRRILPTADFGNASMKVMWRGTL